MKTEKPLSKPELFRCEWASTNPIFFQYHDLEWGIPVHDERHLFEMLCLEGMQAGISWLIVLQKRENYRKLFNNFQAEKIAKFNDSRLEEILEDRGIIRNRLKVYSIRQNARAFLKVKQEYGSFDAYIWQFVNGKPINNHPKTMIDLPTQTPISEKMAKDLKKKGFKFIGPVIIYSFMQAVGMVNDHTCSMNSSIK